MHNMYASNNNSTYGSVEQDYNAIREALSAKPEMLQAILQSSKLEAHEHTVSALKKGTAIKPDIPEQLAHAEALYQATLSKHTETLLALYQKLPVDRKLDLLIYAEEIGEANDKARKLASEQMQAERAKAIAAHHAEAAHKDEIKHHPAADNPNTPAKNDAHTSKLEITPTKDSVNPSQAQVLSSYQQATITKEAIPEPPQEKGLIDLIGIGNPAAVTVNLPFTAIPGLPALSKILEKIDKTTHFDLGFTIKGVADRAPNPDGSHDLLYRLSYAGAGIMSSNANLQITPMALKVQESVDKDKWGGNSSIFTRHKSDNLGDKFSVNFNDSDGSINYAQEYSFQKPSNRFISTLTGGHHFSRESSPAFRIPAEFVPTLTRIVAALPDKEETDIIFDHIDKVIPVNQAVEVAFSVADKIVDKIDTIVDKVQPSIAAVQYAMYQKLIESGLSVEDQATVFARICENCEKSVQQGEVPVVHIKEKTSPQQVDNAEQNQL